MTVLESEDTIETKDTVQVSEEAQPVDQEIEPNDSTVVNTEIKEQIIDESLPNKQEEGELQSEAVEESGALPPADGHEEAKVDLEEETLADANILQTNNNPQQTTIAQEVTKQTHDNISSNDNVNTEVKQTTQPSAEANEDVINSYRIFISKLAYEATHNDLQSYFSQFGNITDIHIPRYSGNPAVNKGYGFVSFDNEASLVKALNVSSHIILGREVVLHRAIGQKHPGGGKGADEAPHPVRDRYPRSKRQYEGNDNYGSRYNKRGRDDRYRSEYYPPDRGNYGNPMPYQRGYPTFDPHKPVNYIFSGSARMDHYGEMDHNSHYDSRSMAPTRSKSRNVPKLFIGRLDPDTSVGTMRHYFGQFGEIAEAYIPRDSYTLKGKGFGFLTFTHKDSILAVMQPNAKHYIDGREVVVDYADMGTR